MYQKLAFPLSSTAITRKSPRKRALPAKKVTVAPFPLRLSDPYNTTAASDLRLRQIYVDNLCVQLIEGDKLTDHTFDAILDAFGDFLSQPPAPTNAAYGKLYQLLIEGTPGL